MEAKNDNVMSVEEYCTILVEAFVDVPLQSPGAISEVNQRKMRTLVVELADLAGHHDLKQMCLDGREDVRRIRACLKGSGLDESFLDAFEQQVLWRHD